MTTSVLWRTRLLASDVWRHGGWTKPTDVSKNLHFQGRTLR